MLESIDNVLESIDNVLESIDNAHSTFFFHRRIALDACCFMYTLGHIHCFNRIVQFLV